MLTDLSVQVTTPARLSRRNLFSILPATAAGCLGCAAAARCAAQAEAKPSEHSWTEKSDMTWEAIFRFAYQKDLIPILKALSEQIGREKFVQMLAQTTSGIAAKGMAGRKTPNRDLATFTAGMKAMPPLFQHALSGEILEDTPQAFEYRVSRCLWAKSFRDENAADIGYAMVCHPDLAIATAFNPKLKLIRTKTLMQGGDSCQFRYVMAA